MVLFLTWPMRITHFSIFNLSGVDGISYGTHVELMLVGLESKIRPCAPGNIHGPDRTNNVKVKGVEV